MREIVFRGKRKDSGEWVCGFYCPVPFGSFPCSSAITSKELMNSGCWQPEEVIPETVGQYTGLTDKNGKKIFEGDIVKVYLEIPYLPSQTKKISAKCVIKFNTEKSSYYAVSISNEEYALCFVEEIIGNIHDNPELMEGGE